MNIDEFEKKAKRALRILLDYDLDTFIINMKKFNHQEDTFCDWMMTFLAWAELGNKEDCEADY